jgi:hypothetical protein
MISNAILASQLTVNLWKNFQWIYKAYGGVISACAVSTSLTPQSYLFDRAYDTMGPKGLTGASIEEERPLL